MTIGAGVLKKNQYDIIYGHPLTEDRNSCIYIGYWILGIGYEKQLAGEPFLCDKLGKM